MKVKLLLSALLLVIITQNVYSQFKIGLQVRPRTEFRNGFKKPLLEEDKPALFTEQRTRLNIGYQQDAVELKLSIQDVRIWGETGQINKSDGLTSVHEAYAIYHATPKSAFKIGRQQLVYDDHRVLGSLGWAAQARSHDAVRYMYTDTAADFTLHLVGTWNQDHITPEPALLQGSSINNGNYYNAGFQRDVIFALNQPKSIQFLWLEKVFNKGEVSFLAMNTSWQRGSSIDSASVEHMPTIGINPSVTLAPGLKAFGTFYYQFGNQIQDVDKQSMLVSADVAYSGLSGYKGNIGMDYLSGDDPETEEDEFFNPLFGTHHKFYGFMDYFYVGNPHGQVGLFDFYLKNSFKLRNDISLLAHLHNFSSPVEVQDAEQESMSSNLGTEIDLIGVFSLKQDVTLKIGYSQMFATETMDQVKGIDSDNTAGYNNWAWIMINFNPVLFSDE